MTLWRDKALLYIFISEFRERCQVQSFILIAPEIPVIYSTSVGHMQKEHPLLKQLHGLVASFKFWFCLIFFIFFFLGKGNKGLSKVDIYFFSQSYMLQVKAQNWEWLDPATFSHDEQSTSSTIAQHVTCPGKQSHSSHKALECLNYVPLAFHSTFSC